MFADSFILQVNQHEKKPKTNCSLPPTAISLINNHTASKRKNILTYTSCKSKNNYLCNGNNFYR